MCMCPHEVADQSNDPTNDGLTDGNFRDWPEAPDMRFCGHLGAGGARKRGSGDTPSPATRFPLSLIPRLIVLLLARAGTPMKPVKDSLSTPWCCS